MANISGRIYGFRLCLGGGGKGCFGRFRLADLLGWLRRQLIHGFTGTQKKCKTGEQKKSMQNRKPSFHVFASLLVWVLPGQEESAGDWLKKTICIRRVVVPGNTDGIYGAFSGKSGHS